MSVLGCQLSQPILFVQGSARGSALPAGKQGSMSVSLTNRNLALPAGAARPFWMDNPYATEQNGSFVPPALTTSIEKMLLVMPSSRCTSSFVLPLCCSRLPWGLPTTVRVLCCQNGTEQCTNIRRVPDVCFGMWLCCNQYKCTR